ncbi:LppU/SCO3897 family protein [Nocardia transvalensis]|uniref:LppU/SCO3897 family protein n=1 Tax=Nocardia transvalensis TaxID=37333 RepID=UPI002B4B1E63|nr:hypothetical protein [Nocardia transvalensis]
MNGWAGRAFIGVLAAATTVAGCSAVTDAGKSDTARAEVGDCIDVGRESSTLAAEPVDCSSGAAVYTVMSTSDRKRDCGPEYSSYEETRGGRTLAFLCLAPNLEQDNCYRRDSVTGFSHADCASAEATVRVVRRIDGTSDQGLCDPSGTFLTLSEPKLTFCFANPRA